MPVPPPTTIGRYQLVERLAMGGMAELWKALVVGAHGFKKQVVIKKILPHLAADAAFVAMFIDEANITARLDHPKIVQVLELGTSDEQLYIAMELVDGLDVLALLRGCMQKKVLLPAPLAVYIAREVLDALDYAHEVRDEQGKRLGIVHRDVSPSNVLISRRGDVKLADFGIAHAVERQQKTQAGALKGKYGYMSPEQVVGRELTGRSDLFSVGIVLAEMLMVRRLFVAHNDLDLLLMVRDVKLDRLDKHGATIDPDLRELLMKALERDPKDRFPTAGAFRDALDEWLFFKRQRVMAGDLATFLLGTFGADLPRPVAPAQPAPVAAAALPAVAGQVSPVVPFPQNTADPAAAAIAELPIVLEIDEEPGPAVVLPRVASPPCDELVIVDDSLSAQTTGRAGAPRDEADFFDVTSELGLELPAISCRAQATGVKPAPAAPAVLPAGVGIVAGTSDDEGDFVRTPPIHVLYRLAVERVNGLLVAENAARTKEIYLVGGVPEFVSSNAAAELFGEHLVAKGAVSRSELSMALSMMPHFGGRLGDTLVGLGLMKPLDVFRHLTQQVRDKIIDVCTWGDGHYRWYSGKRNPREAFPLGLDAFEVLGAGAAALPGDLVSAWARPVGAKRPVAAKHPRVVPEAFRLGAYPREVCGRLDGKRTVYEHADRFVDDEERMSFLRTLYLLVQTDLAFLA